MRFFLPFWSGDKVFEKFEPWSESRKGRPLYIWETFPDPPLDGILVSRINLSGKKGNKTSLDKVRKSGVHDFLRFNGTIMGDCGAFGYIDEEKPLYEPLDTLDFYHELGFNMGVTVDHLIIPGKAEQKEYRWDLTIENAKKMFDEAQKSRYDNLRLIGAIQGWDPNSYIKAFKELFGYGFDYVGIGGLARRPTEFIQKLLMEMGRIIKGLGEKSKRRIWIHLFGVARESLLPLMNQVGVSSFDSATFLRKAWIAAKKNYHLNDDVYTAIRVEEKKVGKMKKEEIFGSLRRFNDSKATVDEVIELIKRSDLERIKLLGQEYVKTLKDRPWEKCECKVCKDIGIHVCIFRGRERNMRRGFHNVYQFYKKFRSSFPKIFVFTNCTMKKDENPYPMPSYRRYSASPVFKVFWNNVFDLPVEVGMLSAKFGLIDWSKRIPYYDYKMQEKDVLKFVEELKDKLKIYDKIFFVGLGLYRDIVNKVKEGTNLNIEIFPRQELTTRDKLDILEYTKQMKAFREAIIQAIPEKCRLSEEIEMPKPQPTLEEFTR